MKPAMFHMVCGALGAGKTTYSMLIEKQLGGICFSIDEWMMALFAQDSPQPLQWDWTIERVHRCEAQIGKIAARSVQAGVPVVLDLSFLRAADREKAALVADAAGIDICLHYIDTPQEERWRRVEERNLNKGPTFALEISRPIFDFFEHLWEPPSQEELTRWHAIRIEPAQ